MPTINRAPPPRDEGPKLAHHRTANSSKPRTANSRTTATCGPKLTQAGDVGNLFIESVAPQDLTFQLTPGKLNASTYGCVQKVCVLDFEVCNDGVTRK